MTSNAREDLETMSWFWGLTPARQEVVEQVWNRLGSKEFRRFTDFIHALKLDDYSGAANALKDSKLALDEEGAREVRGWVRIMLSGEFVA